MFDLFKKEEINSLKVRIIELEEENRKLVLRLEKKDEKTKKTIATKQEVDHELNEATKKLASLESEIQKLKKETSPELRFCFSETLSRHKLDELLFLLGSLQSKTSTMITIYLARDETPGDISLDILDQIDNSALRLIEKIESSTGKAIFYDTNRFVKFVIIPVLPILHSRFLIERRFELEPLKNCLECDKILVVNAHAGETFTGIMEGNALLEHEIIRSSVMGKHTKGGFSQKRFQSLVEEDVRHHADKVRAVLGRMAGKNKDIQYVIAGGEGKLIKMIMEGYDIPLIMKSMDAVSNGNIEQLQREIMAVRVYGI